MLDDFKYELRKFLNKPLPGINAQKLMAPSTSDHGRFNLEEKKNARLGAVLILLFPKDNQVYFPLILRPEYDGIHAGQISLPGGKKEDSDSDLIETALRETREEIGIDTADVEILGSLTDLYITVSNFKVRPVVGISNSTPSCVPDKSEVEQIIETDINNILDDSLIKEKEIVVERNMPDFNFKHRLNAPYFDIDGHVVWGATAMILSEFSVILKQIN